MAVTLSSLAGAAAQFFDNNGVPLAGGLIYTYLAGTNTPAATYTSSTGLIAHSNPIVLDAAGRIATGEVWLTSGVDYKFLVKTSLGVQLGSYDNIPSINDFTSIYADLANTTNPALGDALVGFRQSSAAGNASGAVGRTVHQKLQETVSVQDFGAVGDGVADDTAAIQAAIDWIGGQSPAGGIVFMPKGLYLTSATLDLDYDNVRLVGEATGVNHNTGGTVEQDGATQIIGGHVNGAVIRIWNRGCSVENLVVSSTATRRAATSGTKVFGIWVETVDTALGNSNGPWRILIERVHVTKQPSHGIVLIGNCIHSMVIFTDIDNCYGHGLVISNGTITGRTNLTRPGQINLFSIRSSRTGGCAFKFGELGGALTDFPYRISSNNLECFQNLTEAVFKPTGNEGCITAFVENSSFDDCATGGNNANNGINISGTFNLVNNHRFIQCEPYAAYISDFGISYRTTDITFKCLYINNTEQSSGYYDPAIYVSDPAIRNISVDATSYFGIISTWINIANSEQVYYKGDRNIDFVGTVSATIRSWEVIPLADDNAGYFVLDPDKQNYGIVAVSGNASGSKFGMVAYRVGDGSAYCTVMNGSSGFTATTGVLTGTTGVDGDLTISADISNRRIYIENRTGSSRSYVISNFGDSTITNFVPV